MSPQFPESLHFAPWKCDSYGSHNTDTFRCMLYPLLAGLHADALPTAEHNSGIRILRCSFVANTYQVAAGLAASMALLLLSRPASVFQKGGQGDSDIPIEGTGLLHAIWMYRNHEELKSLLPHVDNPTTTNLREAGMVRTRLVAGQLRKRRSCESF
jgi:hypothetical protein